MSYNNYSEEDVKYQFITPSIENAGWDKTQIRFEYSFTDGQMLIRGTKAKRGARKRADYLLSYKPLHLFRCSHCRSRRRKSLRLSERISLHTD